jgi:hypothetical protein
MRVIDTGIPDGNSFSNTDNSKIILMDKVIGHFIPLFRDEIDKKNVMFKKYRQDLIQLSSGVSKTKTILVKLKKGLKKETLIQEILDDSAFLLNRDILYGQNKKIVMDILDSFDRVNDGTLITHSRTLKSLIRKNVNKVNVS